MSTLVTGGTGFTGGALCRKLVEQGEDVVAFVRPGSPAEPLRALGIECRDVDIKDREEVLQHFDGIDTVYHLAAAYRVEHADREEFWRVNVDGTRHLLEAARQAGARRFVHCSTVGVQGEIVNPPAKEDDPFAPGDHYQESKVEGEKLARRAFDDGLPGCVIRPVGIYGPGDRRFLKLFRPISKGYFVMIGSGRSLYHLTYIDDLVQGFLLAGTREGVQGEVFTIAGERYTTLRELVDQIALVLKVRKPWLRVPSGPVLTAARICERAGNTLGIRPPLYPRRVEFFTLDRAFSIEKARRVLGYQPRFDLPEGLALTAAGYRRQGWI